MIDTIILFGKDTQLDERKLQTVVLFGKNTESEDYKIQNKKYDRSRITTGTSITGFEEESSSL